MVIVFDGPRCAADLLPDRRTRRLVRLVGRFFCVRRQSWTGQRSLLLSTFGQQRRFQIVGVFLSLDWWRGSGTTTRSLSGGERWRRLLEGLSNWMCSEGYRGGGGKPLHLLGLWCGLKLGPATDVEAKLVRMCQAGLVS